MDEGLDVGVVATQHGHLGAAAAAGGFDRLTTAVEHAHVADRAGGAAARGAHPGALRADAREVVAHAAAAAHRLGGLGERGIDAGDAVLRLRDGVAHGLHEAVDERGGELGAGGGVDAAGRHEAALQRVEEARGPGLALLGRLHLRERQRDTRAHVVQVLLVALGVFLEQHLGGDVLRRQAAGQRLRGVGGCGAS